MKRYEGTVGEGFSAGIKTDAVFFGSARFFRLYKPRADDRRWRYICRLVADVCVFLFCNHDNQLRRGGQQRFLFADAACEQAAVRS